MICDIVFFCVSDSGPGLGNNASVLGKDNYSVSYQFHFQKKALIRKKYTFRSTVVIWSAHWTDPDQVIRTLAGSFIVFLDEAFYSHSAPLHTGERHFIQAGWRGRGGGLLLVTDSNNASCYIYTQGSYRSWKTWKVLELKIILAFSRTGKSWEKATGPGKFWKSVKLS